MPNKNLIRQSILAIAALLSSKAFGDNVRISKALLVQAQVPEKVVEHLVAEGVLLSKSSSCFRVDTVKLENLSATKSEQDLVDFKAWLDKITSGTVSVDLCDVTVAKTGTNDIIR